jgi:hypothetical protein
MRPQVQLFFFLIISLNKLAAQDTIVSIKDFKVFSLREIDEEKLVRSIFDYKSIDSWQYRIANNSDYSFDIAYYGGCNFSKSDSLAISLLKSCYGFDRNNYDTPGPLPNETFDYIVYKSQNQYLTINDPQSLIQFLKPIHTIQEALYFLSLVGFQLNYGYDSIHYRCNTNFIELIMTYDFHEKYVQLDKGGIFYYPVYYIRIDENGKIYKKKIGVQKYRVTKFIS